VERAGHGPGMISRRGRRSYDDLGNLQQTIAAGAPLLRCIDLL